MDPDSVTGGQRGAAIRKKSSCKNWTSRSAALPTWMTS